MAKKKNRFIETLLSIVFIVPKIFGLVGDLGTLVKLEAHEAAKKMTIILFLAILCAILFASTWLGLLGLLFLYLATKLSAIAALAIVLLLNIFFMVIVGLIMLNLKKNIFFPATLRHLSKIKAKF